MPIAVPQVLEDAVGGLGLDRDRAAAAGEHVVGEAVHAAEVDAVGDVGCEALHERLHHLRQRADVGGDEHAAAGGAGDVRGAVQGDDGLAGAGGAADAHRAR